MKEDERKENGRKENDGSEHHTFWWIELPTSKAPAEK
jgi:hypothetical protein